jgi:hypothetical protein
LVRTSIGADLNVLLLYARFGLAGVASATVIAELITGMPAYYFVNRYVSAIGAWLNLRHQIFVALVPVLGMYLAAAHLLWLRACVALALSIAGVCLIDSEMLRKLNGILTTRHLIGRDALPRQDEAARSGYPALPPRTSLKVQLQH